MCGHDDEYNFEPCPRQPIAWAIIFVSIGLGCALWVWAVVETVRWMGDTVLKYFP